MDEQLLQNLKNAIDNNEQIAVLVGKNPTLDQMAAGLSFFLTLTNAKKKVTMLSASEATVEVGSLVGIDKLKTTYSSQEGDLIVTFPYKDGEIEKVSYNEDEENHLLNIVVTAGENGLSFSDQDVIFSRGSGKLNLLITVGTAHLDDVYSVITPDSLTDATIINVDNADVNERYGEINLVSSRFSSLSEQVADLLLTLGYDPEMDEDICQNLMSGIVSGTSNFQNPNTSYLAFEIASILMKKGAKRVQPFSANPQVANEFMSFMQQGNQQKQNTPSGNQGQGQQNQRRDQQQNRGQNQSQNRRPQQQNQPKPNQNQPRQQNNPQSNQGQNQQFQQPQGAKAPVAPMDDFLGDLSQTKQEVPQPEEQPQPAQQGSTPPADWLTPKVYKGSTNV